MKNPARRVGGRDDLFQPKGRQKPYSASASPSSSLVVSPSELLSADGATPAAMLARRWFDGTQGEVQALVAAVKESLATLPRGS